MSTESHEAPGGSGQVGEYVLLPDGSRVSIRKRVEVSINPGRNFHNVSACRAPGGDFLVSHQDSLKHGGRDCYVHQWRSGDEGLTWQDEDADADIRGEGLDARAGELGVSPSGRMVMVVQRVDDSRWGCSREGSLAPLKRESAASEACFEIAEGADIVQERKI